MERSDGSDFGENADISRNRWLKSKQLHPKFELAFPTYFPLNLIFESLRPVTLWLIRATENSEKAKVRAFKQNS